MHLIWNTGVCLAVFFYFSESLRESNFCIKSGKTIDSFSALMKTMVVESLIECSCVCGAAFVCSYAVFRGNLNKCWLYSSHAAMFIDSLTDTVIYRKELIFETPRARDSTIYSSDLATIDSKYVLFNVQTCGCSVLRFMEQTNRVFAVLIGSSGGYTSYIATNSISSGSFTLATPFYDCVSFKAFWITWNTTTIESGKGDTVGVNKFLHFTLPDVIPVLDSIRFYSYGENTTYWGFKKQDPCSENKRRSENIDFLWNSADDQI